MFEKSYYIIVKVQVMKIVALERRIELLTPTLLYVAADKSGPTAPPNAKHDVINAIL